MCYYNLQIAKYCLTLLVICINFFIYSSCGILPTVNPTLNEEFTLSLGKKVFISNENLELKFKDVIEDSRCPHGATCVWQGRAICTIEFTHLGHKKEKFLTQSGITDDFTNEKHGIYNFSFKVEPYPQIGKQINKTEYHLHIIIRKLVNLSNEVRYIISRPQDFNGREITIIGYYRGWDLLHEAQTAPPITRSDWVIRDTTGAIYVSANSEASLPEGLNPGSLECVDNVLKVQGVIRISENGQPYIFARNIMIVP